MRFQRPPVPSLQALGAAGFALACYPFSGVAVVTAALTDLWTGLARTGGVDQSADLLARARADTLALVDMQRAWDLGRLCSSDPVCASHSPEAHLAERYLEGAACHGCLFIAECSCERFNRHLDRTLVVPTVGHVLPVLEVVVGVCLVLGLLTRVMAVASAVLFAAFVVGIASAWSRGLQIECGCFGGGGYREGASSEYPWEIARDAGLLLLSAYLVWRPRTKYALDTLLFPSTEAVEAPAGRTHTIEETT